MVSPQFHVQPDGLFEMVCPTYGNPPTLSHWIFFSCFRRDRPNHLHTQEVLSGQEPVIPSLDQQESLTVTEEKDNQSSKGYEAPEEPSKD